MGTRTLRPLFRLDVLFHERLLHIAGNQVLFRLMEPVKDLITVARMRVVHVTSQRGLSESNQGHRRIAEAVAAHDPQAATTAMMEHLELAQSELALTAPGESSQERPASEALKVE